MFALFVCTWNVQRSKTAESVFKELVRGIPEVSVNSAGTEANVKLGGQQLTAEMLKQADLVFVMEEDHVFFIKKNFPNSTSKVINLDILNVYYRDDPYLVLQLKEKLMPFVKKLRK
ncbi:MAG: protein tyrosine phosphatase [Nanoarchaeota archaeon]